MRYLQLMEEQLEQSNYIGKNSVQRYKFLIKHLFFIVIFVGYDI